MFVDSFPELKVSILLTPKVTGSVGRGYLSSRSLVDILVQLFQRYKSFDPRLPCGPIHKPLRCLSFQLMSHVLSRNPPSLPGRTPSLSLMPP